MRFQAEGNCIYIDSLRHPADVSNFIKALFLVVQKKGFEDVYLDMKGATRAYPNACVPIAAIISYYRNQSIDIKTKNLTTFLKNAYFDTPIIAEKSTIESSGLVLSKIWRFSDSQGVSALTKAYVSALSERIECSSGVLEAFEWCINEIMDNVLQHSGDNEGFIMVVIHPEQHRVAICLADTGSGIYGTLKDSKHKPRSAVDAITMALKEGVTRDPKAHQGNGLWGLLEIVSANSGSLTVTSGNGSVIYRRGHVETFDRLPVLGWKHQGTVVDFQLDTSSAIDISKALGGHRPVNLRLESLETEAGDFYVVVKEHSHGTGTRKAAIELRNFLINLLNQGASKIILDFEGIGVISSSFADELIGKLVVRFGFFNFQQIITMKGMTETVQVILHRSVAQRMMESLQSNPESDEDYK